MSTALLKTAAIAAISVAGLAVTANAQSARYGGHSIASYEGVGNNCAPAACEAPIAPASRYGSTQTVAPVYNQAPIMVDCSVFGNPACGPQVINQPQTVYTQPTYVQAAPQVEIYNDGYSAPTTMSAPVNCPAGTTAQSDGTCMQGSSYSMGSTYTAPATTMSAPANCPAGTTAQSDGTCMQTGSSYSGTSYSSGSGSMSMGTCPSGTSMQADGTCAQTQTTYTGDASPSYGYTTDGSYGTDAYRPIRK